jgi:hypothetical protein
MDWITPLNLDRASLFTGAAPERIDEVEQIIGRRFTSESREFLLFADGGTLHGGRFIVYSAGPGFHPDETLVAANKGRDEDFPLVAVGRDASSDFGFSRERLEGHSGTLRGTLVLTEGENRQSGTDAERMSRARRVLAE